MFCSCENGCAASQQSQDNSLDHAYSNFFKMFNFCVFSVNVSLLSFHFVFHECLIFLTNCITYVGLCKCGWIATSHLLGPVRRTLYDDAC